MTIERDSLHFQILERLCGAPKPVRGTSAAMLDRDYAAPHVVEELKELGLVRERGWHDGPGAILIPTAEGEQTYAGLAGSTPRTLSPRWVKR